MRWKVLGQRATYRSLRQQLRNMSAVDPLDLFSFLAIVVIFVFYCIPQSKRSAYLMPIYPFIAYFVARMLFWLQGRHPRLMRSFAIFISVLGTVLFVAFIVLKFIDINPDWFHGRRAHQNYTMMLYLQQAGQWWQWLLLVVGVCVLKVWWDGKRQVTGVIILILACYVHLDAIYKPAVLNAKSVRNVAAAVDAIAPESAGRLYEFIEGGVLALGDPVHYFEMNFYLHDRVGNFYTEKPQRGFLMIGVDDAERWLPRFGSEGYCFAEVYRSGQQRVAGQPLLLLRFEK